MVKLLYADLTYKIRRALFNVYNSLGFGHKEQVYQKSLEKEFKDTNIIYKKEPILEVVYKNIKVGTYKPDFTIENKVIVEIKATQFLPKSYEQQLLHYLKSTNFKVGLLVNFGNPKLEIRRLVWSGFYQK